MSIIREKVKEAFDNMLKDGDITKLVKAFANVADKSVNCEGHARIMYDAIDAQLHIFLSDEYCGGFRDENS